MLGLQFKRVAVNCRDLVWYYGKKAERATTLAEERARLALQRIDSLPSSK